MATIYKVRDSLKLLYGKYEMIITPLLKFLLAMAIFIIINNNVGYMGELSSFSVVLVLSLLSALLPLNATLIMAAALTVMHLYRLSLICAAVVLLLFVLLFLLYFRFSPKDGLAVLLLPIFFILHIPYVVPLCLGLTGNLFSVAAVSCGVIVYYTVRYVSGNSASMGDLDLETIAVQVRTLLNGILENHTMQIMVLTFSAAVIVVYLIHRLSRKHSWTIALACGTLTIFIILLAGETMYTIDIRILPLILSLLVSFGLALLMEMFIFSVDYSRTEKLQFEDDEYYYYVTAVPKIVSEAAERGEGRSAGEAETAALRKKSGEAVRRGSRYRRNQS